MPEPKRVRDDQTGHEYSTYGIYDGLTVLDEPAVDERTGELLPPKYPAKDAPAPKPHAVKPADPAGAKATQKEN
ncbi:MAG TPA: hypothetical protein VGL05_19465 [Kribbella sp.]